MLLRTRRIIATAMAIAMAQRLGDVVVTADVQPLDDVVLVVEGGDEYDGNLHPFFFVCDAKLRIYLCMTSKNMLQCYEICQRHSFPCIGRLLDRIQYDLYQKDITVNGDNLKY